MDAERLGQQLRAAREARELTIEDVEQALRIRKRFLEAFETGAYEDLPGAVQARGFLRNYARYLRLDEDAILADYDSIQQALPIERRTPQGPASTTATQLPVVPPAPPDQGPVGGAARRHSRGRRAGVIVGALLGLVLLLGLCLGGTRLVEQLLNTAADQEQVDLVDVLPTVPTLTPSATFIASMTPLPGARVIDGATPITDRVVLVVEVVQRSFIRVIVDGTVAFEGTVRPGTQLEYQAQQTLTLESSNGAGLDVVFNNLPLGALGARGEAIEFTFTPDLALTPIATPEPPTATPTPEPETGAETGEGAFELTPGETTDSGVPVKSGQETDAPTALPLP
ncbi:MAG: helix-turn-helix domain-containing protein, partial [Anaerolineae bacterium]|nr:helix-turn-helix domain-containing protein [Anaerolineae bacterium]